MIDKKFVLAGLLLLLVYFFPGYFSNDDSLEIYRNYQIITKTQTLEFKLKVASTPVARAKGLMGVKYMPTNEGMIFIYSKPRRARFWMKNTYLPLDIIFIDGDGVITQIVKNAEPLNKRNIMISYQPIKYAIEINGGLCDALDIAIGDQLKDDIP